MGRLGLVGDEANRLQAGQLAHQRADLAAVGLRRQRGGDLPALALRLEALGLAASTDRQGVDRRGRHLDELPRPQPSHRGLEVRRRAGRHHQDGGLVVAAQIGALAGHRAQGDAFASVLGGLERHGDRRIEQPVGAERGLVGRDDDRAGPVGLDGPEPLGERVVVDRALPDRPGALEAIDPRAVLALGDRQGLSARLHRHRLQLEVVESERAQLAPLAAVDQQRLDVPVRHAGQRTERALAIHDAPDPSVALLRVALAGAAERQLQDHLAFALVFAGGAHGADDQSALDGALVEEFARLEIGERLERLVEAWPGGTDARGGGPAAVVELEVHRVFALADVQLGRGQHAALQEALAPEVIDAVIEGFEEVLAGHHGGLAAVGRDPHAVAARGLAADGQHELLVAHHEGRPHPRLVEAEGGPVLAADALDATASVRPVDGSEHRADGVVVATGLDGRAHLPVAEGVFLLAHADELDGGLARARAVDADLVHLAADVLPGHAVVAAFQRTGAERVPLVHHDVREEGDGDGREDADGSLGHLTPSSTTTRRSRAGGRLRAGAASRGSRSRPCRLR